jgi:alkylation response protein AidB-like acyl-CoA dehydrogenase
VPFPAACRVIEILAGACLSTTFVWMQHHGVVRAAADAPAALRQQMLGPLCRGERRAGVALAGLLPGPPRLRARAVEGGYVLDRTSPWVTGWEYITRCTSPPGGRTTPSCGPCSTPRPAPGAAPGPH